MKRSANNGNRHKIDCIQVLQTGCKDSENSFAEVFSLIVNFYFGKYFVLE